MIDPNNVSETGGPTDEGEPCLVFIDGDLALQGKFEEPNRRPIRFTYRPIDYGEFVSFQSNLAALNSIANLANRNTKAAEEFQAIVMSHVKSVDIAVRVKAGAGETTVPFDPKNIQHIRGLAPRFFDFLFKTIMDSAESGGAEKFIRESLKN